MCKGLEVRAHSIQRHNQLSLGSGTRAEPAAGTPLIRTNLLIQGNVARALVSISVRPKAPLSCRKEASEVFPFYI